MGLGEYIVKEDGLCVEHNVAPEAPCKPEEFLTRFRNNFQMNVLEQLDEDTLVIELIHCDASFANALRRILLSEVPTVAVESVFIWNNTSLIHDEVLSHRLGLIPLNVDARLLDDYDHEQEQADSSNTVAFQLKVACPKEPPKQQTTANSKQEDDDDDKVVEPNPDLEHIAKESSSQQQHKAFQYPKDRPYTHHVYSRDLEWEPHGDQQEQMTAKPIHDDILIAKLRPGQQIELEAHAIKGIGKDHAKFSPVATASYRLMPRIEMLHDVYDAVAEELVHVYEPGVFELVPITNNDPPGTRHKAKLVNPYACTMSRNYMRHPDLAKAIRMSRIPDHFIFSIESVGAYRPGVLLAEALRILQRKCHRVMDLVDETVTSHTIMEEE